MILIGENIHVISNQVSKAIEDRDPAPIQRLAQRQTEAGADYLDLNLGPMTRNTVETVQWIVNTVQEVTHLPLSIDTPNAEAMEAGLAVCKKTPLINSASGTTDGKEKMLPLAKKYGANVIIMTLNDEGLPSDADDRAACVIDIVEYGNELGIPNEDMWIDGVLMPVCVNQDQIVEYFEFLKMVPDVAPGAKTITGLSNVSSCGTPKELRSVLNQTCFEILRRFGQSALIVDMLDDELLRLNRGERSNVSDLVGSAMDDEDFDISALSSEEAAYVRTVDVLLKRKLYSHSWLE